MDITQALGKERTLIIFDGEEECLAVAKCLQIIGCGFAGESPENTTKINNAGEFCAFTVSSKGDLSLWSVAADYDYVRESEDFRRRYWAKDLLAADLDEVGLRIKQSRNLKAAQSDAAYKARSIATMVNPSELTHEQIELINKLHASLSN
ncbi:hypothetical protein [Vibrio crassostreae]|uniref:hypothetical protein n=1 Tax=Vibrio crassostreae TaxID=246167 RepID=UPI001B308274|nr:hypothetical protein [Vibrio crassostreae]